MTNSITTTKIVVEGVDEYRRSISEISAEIKKYQSALNLVEGRYKDHANSLEALSNKNHALNELIEKQGESVQLLAKATKSAEETQSSYASKIVETKTKLTAAKEEQEKLAARTEENAAAYDEAAKRIGDYQKQLSVLKASQSKAKDSTIKWQTSLNYAQKDLNILNADLEKNKKYLDEANSSSKNCAASIDRYGKDIKKAVESTDGARTSFGALAKALKESGIQKSVEEIVAVLKSCVNTSTEFESAMAGVSKAVNGSDEQLAAISDGIKELALSIPVTTTELAAVAEAAGRLGIAADDVLPFTEVMANLGVATELTADQAATLLAKFADATGMNVGDYERLGSTLVALGNDFATTESKITSMAQDMASAASMAGMSQSEILALSAALSSLGIDSEAGSSAMSELIKKMQAAVETGVGLDSIAATADMSAATFKAAWGESAVGALDAFIQGLDDTERSGASAVGVLEDMGLTEMRVTDAVRKLASSKTVLTDALKTAGTAWEQNNALQKEAEKQCQTTESRMTLLENATNTLKIAVGDALTPALSRLAETGTAAMKWAADFVEKNPGIVALIGAVAAALGVLALIVTGYTQVVGKAIPAIVAFNTALKDNPFGLAATALSVLVAGITALVLLLPDTRSETDKLIRSIKETADAYDELNAKLDEEKASTASLMERIAELSSIEDKSAAQKAKLAEFVNQLNESVPELALAYDSETDSLNMSIEAIRDRIKAQEDAAEYENQVKRLIELEAEQAELEKELAEQQELRAKNAESQQYTTAYYDIGYANDIGELTEAIAANQAQQDELTASVNAYAAAQAEAAAREAALREPYEASVLVVQGLKEEMRGLKAQYEEAYQSAYDSISGQMGLWESMGDVGTTSAETLNSALESQITYLDDYNTNMESLIGRNIEGIEDFAILFSDGSKESAEALAGLSTASDAEIAEIIGNLKKVEEGKQEFSNRFAEMSTDFATSFDEISERLDDAIIDMNRNAEAAIAGGLTVQGYIDGAKAKEGALSAQFKRLAHIADSSYKVASELQSPSRVMMRAGESTVDGLIVGAKAKEGALSAQFKRLARISHDSYKVTDEQQSPSRAMMRIGQYTIEGLIVGIDSKKNDLKKATADLADTVQRTTETIARSIQQTIKEFYQSNFDSAYESIRGQFGLFEEVKNLSQQDGLTMQSLMDNLESQISYVDAYTANLQKANEMELSEELLSQLMDGSEKSANYLATIASSSAEEIEKLNELYAGLEQSRVDFAETSAGLEGGFESSMDELADLVKKGAEAAVKEMNQAEEAKNSGIATVEGYIIGVDSMKERLIQKYKEIASAGVEAYNSALAMNSPSKVMEKSGRNTIAGLVVGVEAARPDLEWAMQEVAETARRAAYRAIPRGYESISGGSNVVNNNSTSTNQTVIIHSPAALTPSEIARETRNAMRRMSWA